MLGDCWSKCRVARSRLSLQHQKHDIQFRQSGRKNSETNDTFAAFRYDRPERRKDGTAVEQNKLE